MALTKDDFAPADWNKLVYGTEAEKAAIKAKYNVPAPAAAPVVADKANLSLSNISPVTQNTSPAGGILSSYGPQSKGWTYGNSGAVSDPENFQQNVQPGKGISQNQLSPGYAATNAAGYQQALKVSQNPLYKDVQNYFASSPDGTIDKWGGKLTKQGDEAVWIGPDGKREVISAQTNPGTLQYIAKNNPSIGQAWTQNYGTAAMYDLNPYGGNYAPYKADDGSTQYSGANQKLMKDPAGGNAMVLDPSGSPSMPSSSNDTSGILSSGKSPTGTQTFNSTGPGAQVKPKLGTTGSQSFNASAPPLTGNPLIGQINDTGGGIWGPGKGATGGPETFKPETGGLDPYERYEPETGGLDPIRKSGDGSAGMRPKAGQVGTDISNPAGQGILNAPQVDPAQTQYDGFKNPAVVPGASYKPPDVYVPGEEDTVAGQMDKLLDKNSAYMQNATKTGERVADARGMLNSGLAAQYGQKAAIESALPIAQQDAQARTNAQMAGYQGQINAGLADQSYGNQGNIINLQSANSAGLSDQEYNQRRGLNIQEGNIQAAKDLSEYNYQRGLNTQEGNIAAKKALDAYNFQKGINFQQYNMERAIIQQQNNFKSTHDKEVLAIQNNQSLKEIDKKAALALKSQQLDVWNNWRTVQADILSKENIAKMGLTSGDTKAFGSAIAIMGESLMGNIARIDTDPNLTPEAKTKAIKNLQDQYQSNANSLANIYGSKITWGDDEPFSGYIWDKVKDWGIFNK